MDSSSVNSIRMAKVMDNYQLLMQKLDQFIRKFYINQLIRGLLYSIGLILLLFILFNAAEYYYYFGSNVRKGLFYSFIGISSAALIGWVFIPLMKYFKLGRTISHDQAAGIIGDHFPNVKDKLLNILQLKAQSTNSADKSLLMASINQKSEEIKPVPFKGAIDLSKNKQYFLKYSLVPMALFLGLLFGAPSILKEGSNRLINNDKVFERDAPFHFSIEDEDLTVVQFEDYPLTVKVDGEVLPNEVFIELDGYKYRLNKEDANTFTYLFSNVQKKMSFNLAASTVSSEEYDLNVLLKPNITGFDINLDYPNYIGRKDETLSNIGDLVVPVGTNLNWFFNSLNTDDISILFSDKNARVSANRNDEVRYSYKKKALADQTYKLYVSNDDLKDADSISYSISVVPDLHPNIKVEKFVDSLDNKLVYFVGDASDDYGLTSLAFHYKITTENGVQQPLNSTPMAKPTNKQASFDYVWDINALSLKPGDELTYYFEVFDNDGVNGRKSSKTNLMKFELPSLEEIEEETSKNNEEIKKNLEEAKEEAKKIQKDFKKLREETLQKKEMDWQTKKEMEKLLDCQKELEEQINEAKKDFEENMKNQEEFDKTDEEIQEKQEKIQEMFEEVMSDEMKELMQQIQELLQEMDKEEALEKMEEMEVNDEELNMELDRMLELFKKLEVENEMEKAIDKLEELAEKEEKLAEETEKKEKPQEELKKEQEDIEKELEKLKEDMKEMEEKNEQLEKPMDMEGQEESMEDIQEDVDEAQEEMEKSENSKASKKQKSAAQKMAAAAQKMQAQMQSSEEEQMEEDMAALRQLLENLVTLSFDQEELIENVNVANTNTPHYVDLVQDQFGLKDDFKLVEDSLFALSKRIFQIESFVLEKVSEIKTSMKKSTDQLEERKKPQATEQQQKSMRSLNDLAVMLDEIMQQMQQQMAQQMQGNQMCNNPGNKGKGGKVPKDVGKGQQQLNDALQKMKEGMGKDGKSGSKEFAEMMQRQNALRKALEEKRKEAQQNGQGKDVGKELQDIIDGMNKTEEDLANKRLTNETLKRQQDIITRLLKHEKAQQEREYDNKRKAEVAQQQERKIPPAIEQYIKKREAEIDVFKTVSPALKPYYKFLVEEYFKELKSK